MGRGLSEQSKEPPSARRPKKEGDTTADNILYGNTPVRDVPDKSRKNVSATGVVEYYNHEGLLYKIERPAGVKVDFSFYVERRLVEYKKEDSSLATTIVASTLYVTPERLLHRDPSEGPAVIQADGIEEYWVEGKRHRDSADGPAIICADGTEEYWMDNKRHRDTKEGPAVIWADDSHQYWVRGELHRDFDEGPAVVDADGNGEHYVHGKPLEDPNLIENIIDGLHSNAKRLLQTMDMLCSAAQGDENLALNWTSHYLADKADLSEDGNVRRVAAQLRELEKKELIYSIHYGENDEKSKVHWCMDALGERVAKAL